MQNSSFYIVKYLTPNLRCLLCNVLTQPHFNYVCIGWYSNLSKKIEKKKKIKLHRITASVCLQVDIMVHIFQKECETTNWLPIKERFNQ